MGCVNSQTPEENRITKIEPDHAFPQHINNSVSISQRIAPKSQYLKHSVEKTKLVINQTKYDDKMFSQMAVFGYTRGIEYLLSHFVPNDIISLIATYYGFYSYIADFDKSQCGDYLYFLRNTVKKTENNYCCSVFLFGNQIYNDVCAKYELSFKIFNLAHDFMIGYVSCSGDIKDWNNEIGRDNNLYYSTGIYIYKHLRYFEICNKENKNGRQLTPLSVKEGRKPSLNEQDTLKMSFDFLNDSLTIYLNTKITLKIGLNKYKQIIPAFGLNDKNDGIAITDWKFFDHENIEINKRI